MGGWKTESALIWSYGEIESGWTMNVWPRGDWLAQLSQQLINIETQELYMYVAIASYPAHMKGRKSSLGMRLLSLQGDLHLLRSSKMSGRRKLSKDHSSARLFCSGVPVSSSLLAASYDFRALESNGNINILFT